MESCRQYKEQLSSQDNVDIILSDFNGGKGDLRISVEEFNEGVLKGRNIIKLVDNAISSLLFDNHVDKKHISYIILIGGSSKIPYIKSHLESYFPSIPISDTTKYNPHTTVVEGAMRVKVNNLYQKVSESLESCLGFKVTDEQNNSKLQIDFHPGLQIPISVTRYFNLRGNDIDVYRSFNGSERVEGTISVKQAQEKFGKKLIKVEITCNKDTSIVYSVLSEDGRDIGKLELCPKI